MEPTYFSRKPADLEQGEENGPGVVGLNPADGAEAARLFIGDKEPQYEVEELTNRLYHIKDGDVLIAYQM